MMKIEKWTAKALPKMEQGLDRSLLAHGSIAVELLFHKIQPGKYMKLLCCSYVGGGRAAK